MALNFERLKLPLTSYGPIKKPRFSSEIFTTSFILSIVLLCELFVDSVTSVLIRQNLTTLKSICQTFPPEQSEMAIVKTAQKMV